MAGLCWMAVVLAFSTSIGNSLAVDQRSLTVIVGEILDRYFMNNMQFSLAVNIPVDQKIKEIKEALDKDPSTNVQNKVRKGGVYRGTNVVAATFQKTGTYTDHAEARVLDNIQPLIDNSKDHILVLYSYLSPCGQKCANQNHNYNILGKINSAIQRAKWADRAFVFTKVFSKQGNTPIPEKEIRGAIINLGKTLIGQNNIFRCYYPKKGQFQCIKCFNNGVLSDECVKN